MIEYTFNLSNEIKARSLSTNKFAAVERSRSTESSNCTVLVQLNINELLI